MVLHDFHFCFSVAGVLLKCLCCSQIFQQLARVLEEETFTFCCIEKILDHVWIGVLTR